MRKRRRWTKQYEIRRPDYSPSSDYRKGPGHQGKPEHAGISGRTEGHEDGNQAGGAADFQSEGAFRAHRYVCGKRAAAREVRGLPSGLEEGVRAVAGGREDAGVRAEFVRRKEADSSPAKNAGSE